MNSTSVQLEIDSFLVVHDPIFRSNNSVMDLQDSVFWVRFNALEKSGDYDDHFALFSEAHTIDFSYMLFYNNMGSVFFGLNVYAYKRGFWFVAFNDDMNFKGMFILKSINQVEIDRLTSETVKELLSK